MAIYIEVDGVALFKLMVRARLKTDFSFYQFSGELEQFEVMVLPWDTVQSRGGTVEGWGWVRVN